MIPKKCHTYYIFAIICNIFFKRLYDGHDNILLMQTTTKETITKKKNELLLKCHAHRTPEGVEVFVKSEILERFFDSHGTDRDGYTWNGHYGYNMPNVGTSVYRELLSQWGSDQLFIGRDYPNMSFLRVIGLKEGKTFLIRNVHSKPELEKFIGMMRDNVKKLYQDFLKPVNVDVEIAITTTGESD